MPELPEVEVTRRGLAPQLAGRIISGVAVRNPRLRWPISAEVHRLAGSTVRAVLRRGKYLLVDCGDGHLILHLGMSGSLRVLPRDTPPGKHDHFDLLLGDRLLRLRDPRRFGAVLWTAGRPADHPLIAHLGVEPLSRQLGAARVPAVARGLSGGAPRTPPADRAPRSGAALAPARRGAAPRADARRARVDQAIRDGRPA